MPKAPDKPSVFDQLAEIEQEAEQNKVELTTEVQEYIRTHLLAVQQELENREDVTEDDLQFIQEVRMWVGMAEEDRKSFGSIEDMNNEISKNIDFNEAIKRKISLKQWHDLLYVAEVIRKDRKWINETFKFPGDGEIETNGDLVLMYHNFIYLTTGLKINGNLYLKACTSLISIPAGIEVNGSLWLNACTSLTSLASDMKVGGNLYLSDDLQEQVKKDAERLKKEGKIKGEIKYIV